MLRLTLRNPALTSCTLEPAEATALERTLAESDRPRRK